MIMESPNDSILQEDLEAIAKDPVLKEQLLQASVLVTGATGLLGSQLVMALACMNRTQVALEEAAGTPGKDIERNAAEDKANDAEKDTAQDAAGKAGKDAAAGIGGMQIYALVRSEEKARRVFGKLLERGDVKLLIGDVDEPLQIDPALRIDYIIHAANPTSSKYFVSSPVETIQTSIGGTRNVLELAKEKQVKGFLFLSSLEVYGTVDPQAGYIGEDVYGYLDPLNVRSCYSEGKRMAECLCISYGAEYGVPVKIVRLSQTFGAGVAYEDGRVFAEFARCAMEKRDIVLHTAGRTVRTYCYTADAVRAMLYVLTRGAVGQAYNVTNMDTAVSIREMAELVCGLYPEAPISVTFDMPEDISSMGYNPEMVIRLDTGKLNGLGWQPAVGLEEMFRRMIASIRERKEE